MAPLRMPEAFNIYSRWLSDTTGQLNATMTAPRHGCQKLPLRISICLGFFKYFKPSSRMRVIHIFRDYQNGNCG